MMDLKKRLNLMIEKDKLTNPKYLIKVIKSDFYYLISNYFEVDFDDIDIDIGVEGDSYRIEIIALGDRMKTIKSMPE
ncbi:MAG: cell division topological specificity factor MinE [Clostridia bacterium]